MGEYVWSMRGEGELAWRDVNMMGDGFERDFNNLFKL
jgi:hypothetical protein